MLWRNGLIVVFNQKIEGVICKSLIVHADERGWLMEILRADEQLFDKFGQCYVTVTHNSAIKGFHMHRRQTDYIVCVRGMLKMVLYDGRDDSHTAGNIAEIYIGDMNPTLVIIPPGVYHGWKAYAGDAYVINCPTIPYDSTHPDECRMDPHGIGYDWDRIDR